MLTVEVNVDNPRSSRLDGFKSECGRLLTLSLVDEHTCIFYLQLLDSSKVILSKINLFGRQHLYSDS